ncbi:MAG TPA: ATP-binding protein [Gaiellaceae bacterium]|nr:ATP-binding protein [Gaiellaceae bacterium]
MAARLTTDRWIALFRLLVVAFFAVKVVFLTDRFPDGYTQWAWALVALAVGLALLFLVLALRRVRSTLLRLLTLLADFAVVAAFALVFSYEWGSPTRYALVFPLVEAALRFRFLGALVAGLLALPILAVAEWWRAEEFGPPAFDPYRVAYPFGILLLTALTIGWLVTQLRAEARRARARADEAERLRDELGRRVDVFEAANRCARALASSLELDAAFSAFIRELRTLVPFDRTVIVLEEDGELRVMAVAGVAADSFLPVGTRARVAGSILEETAATGQPVYRADMIDRGFVEEEQMVELGLRSRVVAPLQLGGRQIGALSVVRREPAAFRPEEIELIGLLGRLVATAVQNIRTYEAERATVEELRRLSALRADFVSLVSHELRSPMAAVIGSARTLQQRWRELRPEQREAFLAVIGDETSRLAALIGDVLDTSRIDAGTFGYAFADVDLAHVVREAVTTADAGQDDVRLRLHVPPTLPHVRGDRERLRQLLDNLLSNAIKYSDAGGEVEVAASARNGQVEVRVTDRGPGIPHEHQRLIFEKFGRSGGGAKPGTGLGLYIARSFAEAHGGRLDVESTPGSGATFTLTLPVER